MGCDVVCVESCAAVCVEGEAKYLRRLEEAAGKETVAQPVLVEIPASGGGHKSKGEVVIEGPRGTSGKRAASKRAELVAAARARPVVGMANQREKEPKQMKHMLVEQHGNSMARQRGLPVTEPGRPLGTALDWRIEAEGDQLHEPRMRERGMLRHVSGWEDWEKKYKMV